MFELNEIINSILFLSLCGDFLNMRNLVILLIFVSCALSVARLVSAERNLKFFQVNLNAKEERL